MMILLMLQPIAKSGKGKNPMPHNVVNVLLFDKHRCRAVTVPNSTPDKIHS